MLRIATYLEPVWISLSMGLNNVEAITDRVTSTNERHRELRAPILVRAVADREHRLWH
jgi:hypothetical protein